MELSPDRLVETYAEALRAIRGVEAEVKHGADPRGLDAVVWANLSGKKFTLLLEVKRTVYPRDVHQMLHQLHYWRNTIHQPIHEPIHGLDDTVLPVLVAESISAGAQDILRREGVAFFDSGGSLYLAHDGTFLNIVRPPTPAQAKHVRNLYSGARARVLITMLLEKDRWFDISELSEMAKVSSGTASEVLKALEDLAWVRVQGSGPTKVRQIRNPSEVLDKWRDQVRSATRPRKMRRYYIPYLGNENLAAHVGHHLGQAGVAYAFTGEYAAQVFTPYLTHIGQTRARMVWGVPAEEAMQQMDARVVTEGSNFTVIELSNEADLLFRQSEEGLWYANPIHIYLDLMTAEGRAKDMGQYFREKRIQF
jgi:hypothetical protein